VQTPQRFFGNFGKQLTVLSFGTLVTLVTWWAPFTPTQNGEETRGERMCRKSAPLAAEPEISLILCP
jgi:hypothetical protein